MALPSRSPSRAVVAIAAVVAVLILAGGGVGVALSLRKSTPAGCPGCGTNASNLAPLPEAATFTSADDHFSVDYPGTWSVDNQAGDGVTLHTSESSGGQVVVEGLLIVKGDRSTTDTAALIDEGRKLLPPSYSNLTDTGPIRGAHIAEADGDGHIFTATVTAADGTTQNGAVAIVAAARNGLGVVVVGADPVAAKAGGPIEADTFDYLLTEFRWPSGSG